MRTHLHTARIVVVLKDKEVDCENTFSEIICYVKSINQNLPTHLGTVNIGETFQIYDIFNTCMYYY